MIRAVWAGLVFILAGCGEQTKSVSKDAPDFGIEPGELKSGYAFISNDSQALQNDDFGNPGFLWVEKGAQLFGTSGCLDCHKSEDFAGPVSAFPKRHKATGALINLQGQINYCRSERLGAAPYAYESEAMLGLVSFLKNQGAGRQLNYDISPDLQPHFNAGKDYFYQRRGQFNLSCAQCHDDNWGTKMRGDTISQGHINGFPTFRNDWQTLGSAHRRFQACNAGVRAQQSELGSQAYLQLEVYLKARGAGLKNETPSIRR